MPKIKLDQKIILEFNRVYIYSTISDACNRAFTLNVSGQFMFRAVDWSDATIGVVLLILTLIMLSACFFTLVRTLYSVMRGPILALVTKFINANFPGKLAYFTGYLAILIGTGVTMIIQSSSVFTSALTPLVGLGILSLERMYPLTLGANLGTTFTAVIIALSQDAEDMHVAFHVALCHVFFNISGVLLFYPVPMTRLPIKMAKFLGNETAKYRWFAITYMLLVFVAFPAVIFGLSSISWIALTCVTVPFILVVTCIMIINCFQKKRPDILPVQLRTWTALPVWLRSLEPYDNRVRNIVSWCRCFRQGQ